MNFETAKPDFDQIEATLSSLDNDWKVREEAMQILVGNMEHTIYQRQTFERVALNAKVLALQHSDLRSAIVKQASEVVQEAAALTRKYKNLKLYRFSDVFLKEPPFLKALGSANKVIAKHAASAIQALSAHHCVGFETLIQLCAIIKSNKIPAVRERMAEAVMAFMKNVIYPPKASAISLYSELDVCENFNESGQIGGGLSVIAEKPKFYTAMSKYNGLSRPKTAMKERGNVARTAKMRTDKYADDEFRVKKLHPNDLYFFKEVGETLIKDSAAQVRNIAKSIKSELEKLEIALNSIEDDKQSHESKETAEEQEYRQRFVGHDRSIFQSKTRPEIKIYGGGLNSTAANSQISKGFFALKQNRLAKAFSERKEIIKPPMLFPEKPLVKCSQLILEILSDHKMPSLSKVDEIKRILSAEHNMSPNFTLDQYLQLLKFSEGTSSIPLKDVIVRLMAMKGVNDYKADLL
jgi:hypothetical protein